MQLANSETGVVQHMPHGLALCDLTQGFGKVPVRFDGLGVDMAIVSAHKLGGPKGVGALVMRRGLDVAAQIKGGGQEMGRRSGRKTSSALPVLVRQRRLRCADVAAGRWEKIANLEIF